MAGREFVMGARLQLRDVFSNPMRRVTDATDAFRTSVRRADDGARLFRDSQGRLRDSMGRYRRSADQGTESMERQARQAGQLKGRFTALHGAITALAGAAAMKGAFDWLIGANANMEQYQNTLTVVMGSQEKAVDQLKWAEKFAASTPFEIPGIVEATTRLESYGIESKKVLGITGDMASVMGKDLMQAVEAVADAQTGELERLKEFGITKDMIAQQAKALGTEVLNNKGQITDTKAFNAALFSIMEERFQGGMEMQSKSFKGMVSNAKDFIGRIGRQLGQPLFEGAKKRLQGFLNFMNNLEQSGKLDAFIMGVQNAGRIVGNVFSKIGSFIGDTIGNIASKFTSFYADNKPKIDNIGAALMTAFKKARDFAVPILTWLKDTGLPAVAQGIRTVADWVLTAANYFVEKWAFFKPFVIGLAAAWGTYIAVTRTVMAVTKAWTMAQAALNFVMNMNPIGLIITGIGLLIGAGILLVQNWDKVKAFFGATWGWIKTTSVNIFNGILGFFKKWGPLLLAAITGPIGLIVYGVVKHWDKVKAFFGKALTQALEWGGNIIKTIGKGITGAKDWLVGKVKGVFDKVRNLLPFSDAKEGPFSDLTESGKAIIRTLGNGVGKMKNWIKDKVSGVFNKVRDLLPFSDAKKGPFSRLTENGGKIMTTIGQGVQKEAGTLHKKMGKAFEKAPTMKTQAEINGPKLPKLPKLKNIKAAVELVKPGTVEAGYKIEQPQLPKVPQPGDLEAGFKIANPGTVEAGYKIAQPVLPKQPQPGSVKAGYEVQQPKLPKLPQLTAALKMIAEKVKLPSIPDMRAAMDIIGKFNIPAVPKLSTVMDVATRFDGKQPVKMEREYTATEGINPGGNVTTNNSSRSVRIEKLIEKIELHDVGNKDTTQLIDDLMEALYERLKGADDILGNADKGVLL